MTTPVHRGHLARLMRLEAQKVKLTLALQAVQETPGVINLDTEAKRAEFVQAQTYLVAWLTEIEREQTQLTGMIIQAVNPGQES